MNDSFPPPAGFHRRDRSSVNMVSVLLSERNALDLRLPPARAGSPIHFVAYVAVADDALATA